MKKFYVLILSLTLINLFSGCKKDKSTTDNNTTKSVPVVVTTAITSISLTSAVSGGTITSIGGSDIIARGVYYSTNSDPTIDGIKTIDGNGSGSFNSSLKDLTPHTQYYLRAYATNSSGTGYGDVLTFSTEVLSTAIPNSITVTTAKSGGTISTLIGFKPTARGVCWSIKDIPTIDSNKTNDSTGIGSFKSIITGLVANTTYFVRAYASDGANLVYGNTVTLTTKQYGPSVTDKDGNIYHTDTIGAGDKLQVWLVENLKVTHYNNGDAITAITDNAKWSKLFSGAYCSYNNDSKNTNKYGLLYNSYTIYDSRGLCPDGWHVPADNDWTTLITGNLGGEKVAGGKLKEAGNKHWNNPNIGGTNESDFSGLPGGYRLDVDGSFNSIGAIGFFWSSTMVKSIKKSSGVTLNNSSKGTSSNYYEPGVGLSVRCIQNKKP